MWGGLINFFTGISCTRCLSLFEFVKFGLLLVAVVWFLHRKGLFDPLYDRWEGVFGSEARGRARLKRRHKRAHRHSHHAHKRHKSEPGGDHHHHHVLHRQDDDDDDRAAEHVLHRRGRHEAALGVQLRDGLHNRKRRHGSRVLPAREIIRDVGGGVEHWDWRHHEGHAGGHRTLETDEKSILESECEESSLLVVAKRTFPPLAGEDQPY